MTFLKSYIFHLIPPVVSFALFLSSLAVLASNWSQQNILAVSLYGSQHSDSDLFTPAQWQVEPNVSIGVAQRTEVSNRAQHVSYGLAVALLLMLVFGIVLSIANFLDYFIVVLFIGGQSNNINNNKTTNSTPPPPLIRYFSFTSPVLKKTQLISNILLSGASTFAILLSFITMLTWTDYHFRKDQSFYVTEPVFRGVVSFWLLIFFTGISQLLTHWFQYHSSLPLSAAEEEGVGEGALFLQMNKHRYRGFMALKNNNNTGFVDEDDEEENDEGKEDPPEIFQALHVLSGGSTFSAKVWKFHKILAIIFGFASFVFHIIAFALLCHAYVSDEFTTSLVMTNQTTTSTNNNTLLVHQQQTTYNEQLQRLSDGLIISLLIVLLVGALVSLVNTLEWLLLYSDDNTKHIFFINTYRWKKLSQIFLNRFVCGTHLFFSSCLVIVTLVTALQAKAAKTNHDSHLIIAFWVFLGFCCCGSFATSYYFVPDFLLGPLMRELNNHQKDRKLETRIMKELDDNVVDPRDAREVLKRCRDFVPRKEEKDDHEPDSINNKNKSDHQETDFFDPSFIPRDHVLPCEEQEEDQLSCLPPSSNQGWQEEHHVFYDHADLAENSEDSPSPEVLYGQQTSSAKKNNQQQEQELSSESAKFQRKLRHHQRNISHDLTDIHFLDPEKAKQWMTLSNKIQKWNQGSPYVFWQRFEKYVELIDSHKNRLDDDDIDAQDDVENTEKKNNLNKKQSFFPPRLLGNLHPFVVMNSVPTESRDAIEQISFPTSERLLNAVSMLTHSSDTMPLLFQIFSKTAFIYHHERMRRGCYHVTFNVSGVWRHTFLDSFVPLLPPLKDHDVLKTVNKKKKNNKTKNHEPTHHHDEEGGTTAVPINNDENESSGCCSSPFPNCFSSSEQEAFDEANAKKIQNLIRRRLLAPNCQLDYSDIYLPLIQKGLAKICGTYSAAASNDVSIDSLDELHDLCGVPMERFSWPRIRQRLSASSNKKQGNLFSVAAAAAASSSSASRSQQQISEKQMEEFDLSYESGLLTSAFVEMDCALLRYEGKVVDSLEQPIVILTRTPQQPQHQHHHHHSPSSGGASQKHNNKSFFRDKRPLRVVSCATCFVDEEKAQEFERELEHSSQERIRTVKFLIANEQQSSNHDEDDLLMLEDKTKSSRGGSHRSATSVASSMKQRNHDSALGMASPLTPAVRNETDQFISRSPADSVKKLEEPTTTHSKKNKTSESRGSSVANLSPLLPPSLVVSKDQQDRKANQQDSNTSFKSKRDFFEHLSASNFEANTEMMVSQTTIGAGFPKKEHDEVGTDDIFQDDFKPSAKPEASNDDEGHLQNENSIVPLSAITDDNESPDKKTKQQPRSIVEPLDDDQLSSGNVSSPSASSPSSSHHGTHKEEEDDDDNNNNNNINYPSDSTLDNNNEDEEDRDLMYYDFANAGSLITDPNPGKTVRKTIQKFLLKLSDEEQKRERAAKVLRFVLVIVDDEDENEHQNFEDLENETNKFHSIVEQNLTRLLPFVDTDIMPESAVRQMLEDLYTPQESSQRRFGGNGRGKDHEQEEENHDDANYTKVNPSGNLIPIKDPLPLQFYVPASSSSSSSGAAAAAAATSLFYQALVAQRPDIKHLLTTKVKQHFFRNALFSSDNFKAICLSDALLLSKLKWIEWETNPELRQTKKRLFTLTQNNINNNNKNATDSSSSNILQLPDRFFNLASSFCGVGCFYVPVNGLLEDFGSVHPSTQIGDFRMREQVGFFEEAKMHSNRRNNNEGGRGGGNEPAVDEAKDDLLTFQGVTSQLPQVALDNLADYNMFFRRNNKKNNSPTDDDDDSTLLQQDYFFKRTVTDVRIPNRFSFSNNNNTSSSSSSTSVNGCSDWILKLDVSSIGKTIIFVGVHQQDARKDVSSLLTYGRRTTKIGDDDKNNNSWFKSPNNVPLCGSAYQPMIISVFRVVVQHFQEEEEDSEKNNKSTTTTSLVDTIQQSSTNQFSYNRDLYLRLVLEKTQQEEDDGCEVYYLVVPRLQLMHENMYVRSVKLQNNETSNRKQTSGVAPTAQQQAAREAQAFNVRRQQELQRQRKIQQQRQEQHQKKNNVVPKVTVASSPSPSQRQQQPQQQQQQQQHTQAKPRSNSALVPNSQQRSQMKHQSAASNSKNLKPKQQTRSNTANSRSSVVVVVPRQQQQVVSNNKTHASPSPAAVSSSKSNNKTAVQSHAQTTKVTAASSTKTANKPHQKQSSPPKTTKPFNPFEAQNNNDADDNNNNNNVNLDTTATLRTVTMNNFEDNNNNNVSSRRDSSSQSRNSASASPTTNNRSSHNNNNRTQKTAKSFTKFWVDPSVQYYETPTTITKRSVYTMLEATRVATNDQDQKEQEESPSALDITQFKLTQKEQVILKTEAKQVDFVFSVSVPKTTGFYLEAKIPMNQEEDEENSQQHESNFAVERLFEFETPYLETKRKRKEAMKEKLRQTYYERKQQASINRSRTAHHDDDEDELLHTLNQFEEEFERAEKERLRKIDESGGAVSSEESLLFYRPQNSHRQLSGCLVAPPRKFIEAISEQCYQKPSISELCDKVLEDAVFSNNNLHGGAASFNTTSRRRRIISSHQEINKLMHDTRFSTVRLPKELLEMFSTRREQQHHHHHQQQQQQNAFIFPISLIKEKYLGVSNSNNNSRMHFFIRDVAEDTPGAVRVVGPNKNKKEKKKVVIEGKCPLYQVDGSPCMF